MHAMPRVNGPEVSRKQLGCWGLAVRLSSSRCNCCRRRAPLPPYWLGVNRTSVTDSFVAADGGMLPQQPSTPEDLVYAHWGWGAEALAAELQDGEVERNCAFADSLTAYDRCVLANAAAGFAWPPAVVI
jgi:hypothetical protein